MALNFIYFGVSVCVLGTYSKTLHSRRVQIFAFHLKWRIITSLKQCCFPDILIKHIKLIGIDAESFALISALLFELSRNSGKGQKLLPLHKELSPDHRDLSPSLRTLTCRSPSPSGRSCSQTCSLGSSTHLICCRAGPATQAARLCTAPRART